MNRREAILAAFGGGIATSLKAYTSDRKPEPSLGELVTASGVKQCSWCKGKNTLMLQTFSVVGTLSQENWICYTCGYARVVSRIGDHFHEELRKCPSSPRVDY